jgi:hypothetical protein
MTVTMQSALRDVQASTQRFRDLTRELVLTAVEDQPRGGRVHLMAMVHDSALAVADLAEQAYMAVSAPQADRARPKPAAQAVAHVQHFLTVLGAALVRELAAPEMQNDLAALGREHGREISAWVREISRCVQACQIALWTEVQPALLGYWRELADLTDRSFVSGDGR